MPGPDLRRRGSYVLVLLAAFAASVGLRSIDMRALGYAVSFTATAGVLVHAFIKSGRDTRPARTWVSPGAVVTF